MAAAVERVVADGGGWRAGAEAGVAVRAEVLCVQRVRVDVASEGDVAFGVGCAMATAVVAREKAFCARALDRCDDAGTVR